MKTLQTIQKLSKLGKILSKIVFILCLVCGILCAAGILSLLFFPEAIKIGSVTVRGLVDSSVEVTRNTSYAALAMGVILFAGEAVLGKLAERYFRHELADGTPFTLQGARELLRLGICAICIPLGAQIAAQIVYQVMAYLMQDVAEVNHSASVSIGLGIMMIVASLLCKCGAELTQGTAHQAKEPEP